MQHLVDGGVQELGNVVGELILHAGWERLLLDQLELLLDLLDDLGSVGAGALFEDDGSGRMTIDVRVNVKELGAEFDAVAFLFTFGLVPMSAWSAWRFFFAVGS